MRAYASWGFSGPHYPIVDTCFRHLRAVAIVLDYEIAMSEKPSPVPGVDPQQLRSALQLVYDATADEDGTDAMARVDLHDLLNMITATLNVNPEAAIILFKRAVALSDFCATETLPDHLFEDGLPGRVLCGAAAKAAILDVPGDEDGEISHALDGEAMRQALKSSHN